MVDRRANRLGKSPIAHRRRNRAAGAGPLGAQLVERPGRHAGYDEGRYIVEKLGRDPARAAHAVEVGRPMQRYHLRLAAGILAFHDCPFCVCGGNVARRPGEFHWRLTRGQRSIRPGVPIWHPDPSPLDRPKAVEKPSAPPRDWLYPIRAPEAFAATLGSPGRQGQDLEGRGHAPIGRRVSFSKVTGLVPACRGARIRAGGQWWRWSPPCRAGRSASASDRHR